MIVATSHDQLAPLSDAGARRRRARARREAGRTGRWRRSTVLRAYGRPRAAPRQGRVQSSLPPGLARAAAEVHSGEHGELMHVRARYGHGGRLGYDTRVARPAGALGWRRARRPGHAPARPRPLARRAAAVAFGAPAHAVLGRTGRGQRCADPRCRRRPHRAVGDAARHLDRVEEHVLARDLLPTAKLQVDGLVRSYGPQTLRIYRMKPELGPPELEEIHFPDEDVSWAAEWEHFAAAIAGERRAARLARRTHSTRGRVSRTPTHAGPYAAMRQRGRP